jgi:hypothetical protein
VTEAGGGAAFAAGCAWEWLHAAAKTAQREAKIGFNVRKYMACSEKTRLDLKLCDGDAVYVSYW